jgi:predicted heme/steroid binding protein
LFYGIPLLHTGLRVNLTPTPELTLSLQIVNGWNNDPDINSHKTFGANVTYANPALGLIAAATSYVGKEGGTDGDKTRLLVDGVLTKDLGPLSLGANLDYVKLGEANWFGVAGMGRFIVSELLTLALRGEYLKSKNGLYLPVDGAVYEVTAMAAWTVAKHYELRAELRADMSDQEIFAKGAAPRKNQVTGLLAALAYF